MTINIWNNTFHLYKQHTERIRFGSRDGFWSNRLNRNNFHWKRIRCCLLSFGCMMICGVSFSFFATLFTTARITVLLDYRNTFVLRVCWRNRNRKDRRKSVPQFLHQNLWACYSGSKTSGLQGELSAAKANAANECVHSSQTDSTKGWLDELQWFVVHFLTESHIE